ncbi:MAG: helix-turn-helix domain-containing protein [Gammaproteobacteria bacterium]|nr:helix-turn-helix domain-containing protein [Gammaproteobacteria bacterium]
MATLDLDRLKLARKRLGLRQHQVSERLGLSHTLYGQWERGDREPSIGNLRALAQLFEVPVDWLFGDGARDPAARLGERAGDYAPIIDSPEAVLRVATTPEGLRALAADQPLCAALGIEAAEWHMLASLEPPGSLGKQGYLAVLLAVRGQFPS